MRFVGRDAVVVGGTTDIGRATALRLASEGARVVIIDEDPEAVGGMCQEIKAHGGQSLGFDIDLADLVGADGVAQRCDQAGWQADVLVNYQMAAELSSVEEGDLASWERTVRVNLIGPYAWTKAFLPQLKRSGRGSIVHIGSIDGMLGNPRIAAYSASKGGLLPLTHMMAYEFAKYPVRVNLVARAATATPGAPPNPYLEQVLVATPLRRLGTAEETAAAVVFLASDEASYITGTSLVVDGGRTALTPGTA